MVSWLWRRNTLWCIYALLVVIAFCLWGDNRWVLELLYPFRSQSYDQSPVIYGLPANATNNEETIYEPPKPLVMHMQPMDIDTRYSRKSLPQKTVKRVLERSNELEARAALERLMGTPFPKIRPPWLRNPRSGRALECDCYSEAHACCIEVSGKQHFEFPNSFHATRAQFEDQLYRDELKRTLLRKHGDQLIVVPWWIKRKNIESYLRNQLLSHGFKPREN